MGSRLPEWVQWLQAIGPTATSIVTALVAVGVAWVAYQQWVTAKRKLAFDLFERRYSIYDRAMAGVYQAIRDGDVRNAIRQVALVRSEASFVFGPEVEKYLAELQGTLAELGLARTQYDAGDTSDDWPKRSYDASIKLMEADRQLGAIVGRYIRMDHRP